MPRFAIIIENSPRETMVNPIFEEALYDKPVLRPAINPAIKFPSNVKITAPIASPTALL